MVLFKKGEKTLTKLSVADLSETAMAMKIQIRSIVLKMFSTCRSRKTESISLWTFILACQVFFLVVYGGQLAFFQDKVTDAELPGKKVETSRPKCQIYGQPIIYVNLIFFSCFTSKFLFRISVPLKLKWIEMVIPGGKNSLNWHFFPMLIAIDKGKSIYNLETNIYLAIKQKKN